MAKQRVFIIGGGGMVGAAAAQTLTIKEVVGEIVLIDVAEELAKGQAMDIGHAAAYTSGTRVRVGGYGEIRRDDIVVIASGLSLSRTASKSRLELLEANAAITRDVVAKVMEQGGPVFIVMVTNPVDVLTKVALEVSGLPKERVFGTGTAIDTARLRVALAGHLGVSSQEVEAYILGEHGDSSFPALSAASIGGVPLAEFPGYTEKLATNIAQEIRDSAYKIIEVKKSTCYGIGGAVAKIVEALTRDTATTLPVCSMTAGEYSLSGVAIGLPSLISSRGVTILENYPLNNGEMQQLRASAKVIGQAAAKLDF